MEVINSSTSIKFLPYGGIMLKPGVNKVNPKEFNKNLQHPLVVKALKAKVIEIVDEVEELSSTEPQTTEDVVEEDIIEVLVDVDPYDFAVNTFIKDYINDETDLGVLNKYKELEENAKDRVTVTRAIDERIDVIG